MTETQRDKTSRSGKPSTASPMQMKTRPTRIRRTQEERTAETRRALVDAAVRVIHRLGYGGATTALIAEEAGVSRGAILDHFGTRAVLMAEVIRDVFEKERADYDRHLRRMTKKKSLISRGQFPVELIAIPCLRI